MTKNRVLIIAAHPDDEILGCGATMAKHSAQGDDVYVIIAAEGITSRSNSRDPNKDREALKQLQDICLAANKIVGAKHVEFLGFPDNRMDSLMLLDIVKPLDQAIQKIEPHTIYTHHPSDLNIDHQRLHQAVCTAARPLPGNECNLIFFEVPSATGWMPTGGSNSSFSPNYYNDVSEYLEQKMKALDVYKEEMRPFPHARSMEALRHLAHYRGSEAGLKAAEAFTIGRIINL